MSFDPNISFETIRGFIEIVRLGSFSAAAKRMDLTQSALSQRIEKLERSLGAIVLDRESRPVRLTEYGQEFYRIAERLNEESMLFARSLEALGTAQVNSARIAVSEVVQDYFSADLEQMLIPKFERLSVRSSLIPQVQKNFSESLCDIAIAPGLDDGGNSELLPLLEEDYIAVCPKSLGASPIEFASKRTAIPFLSYEEDSYDRRKTQKILRLLSMPSSVSYQLENTRALASAVSNGLGWTIVPPMSLWSVRECFDRLNFFPVEGVHEVKRLGIGARSPMYRSLANDIKALYAERWKQKYGREMQERAPSLAAHLRPLFA